MRPAITPLEYAIFRSYFARAGPAAGTIHHNPGFSMWDVFLRYWEFNPTIGGQHREDLRQMLPRTQEDAEEVIMQPADGEESLGQNCEDFDEDEEIPALLHPQQDLEELEYQYPFEIVD